MGRLSVPSRRRSPSSSGSCARRASTPRSRACRSRTTSRRAASASPARPRSGSTARTSSRPVTGEPFSLTCRVYRTRDGRISPVPDPEDVRDGDEEPEPHEPRHRRPGARLHAARHRRRGALARRRPAVVVFTCNHCPYALAWHDRIADAARDYPSVRFLAINPNDAERYPARLARGDARAGARARTGRCPTCATSRRRSRAPSARRRRRTCSCSTPDGRLRYRGAPDPDHRDPSLNASWLREALDSVLAGEEVARPETDPVGCSVKWRQ